MATLNFPDAPSTGDVYKDGNSGFSYEWNGTVWISSDPSTASNIREIDNISSEFDGSETDFTLKVAGVNIEPANVQQLIISVGGVMQNAGDDYTVDGSTLTFTTAPTAGLTFFGTYLGTALSLNTVADGSVGSSSLKTEDFTIGGSGNTVTIPGNLTVQGTETIINVDELNIQDKTIGIASTNAPTATTQDGAGAIIYGETHIDILYDVDKAALGISTAVSVSGFVTATRAQVGTGVTINNTGIDIGIGGIGIVTTGTVVAASATVGSGVTINNTGIDAGVSAGIVTAKFVKGMGANFSGGTVYSGKVVGTAATIGLGVTINNTGIDAGIGAGIVTASSFVGDVTGTATNSNHVLVTDNESTSESNLITFVEDAASTTGNHGLEMDGNFTYNPSTGKCTASSFTDSKGDVRSVPQNSQGSSYTLVASDAGKLILAEDQVTVPDSVFSAGDVITIVNHTAGDITIVKCNTMYNTADGDNANRTLASRGMATVYMSQTNLAYISGSGLS